jgi:hypothetical protein
MADAAHFVDHCFLKPLLPAPFQSAANCQLTNKNRQITGGNISRKNAAQSINASKTGEIVCRTTGGT